MKLLDYPARLRKVADVGRRDSRQKTPTSGKLGRSVPQCKDVIMARRLRFNGTGSGVNGCPSIHDENWHAELWIDDEASVDTYLRTWKTLRESAVYGVDAQNVISAARWTLRSR